MCEEKETCLQAQPSQQPHPSASCKHFVCLWTSVTCCASIPTQTHDLELSRRTGADATLALGGKPAARARGVASTLTLIFAASVPVHTEATHSRWQEGVVSGLRVGIGADAVRSGAEFSKSATVLMYMCSSGEAVSAEDRPEPGGSSITSKNICKDEQTITVGHGHDEDSVHRRNMTTLFTG